MVLKCVESAWAKLSSTNSVAAAGGNGEAQSPIGTHCFWPSSSRVAPEHGAAGKTSEQPTPLSTSFTHGAAQSNHPTLWQSRLPSTGMVLSGQSVEGSTSTQTPVLSG